MKDKLIELATKKAVVENTNDPARIEEIVGGYFSSWVLKTAVADPQIKTIMEEVEKELETA